MTLPQNVADALNELDAVHDQRFAPWRGQWQTIRTHLMSQEAEVERLREIIAQCAHEVGASISPACSVQFISDVPAEIRAVRRKDKSRLAAANALLSEVKEDGNLCLLSRIEIHLQGAGDA